MQVSKKSFPVLWQGNRGRLPDGRHGDMWKPLGCPKSIPWDMIAPREKQALENHDQTLKRLAERGGLSPAEMVAVLDGHGYRWITSTTNIAQIPRLIELVKAYEQSTTGIQGRIARWLEETLGDERREAGLSPLQNRSERALRFVEEAVELAQSIGVEREQLHRLVDYVMNRPVGETAQEVGGAMTTLYAVAASCGVDADARALQEIERMETPEIRAKVRRRQQEKREAFPDGSVDDNAKELG